jgi:hypothetical protein
LGKIVDYARDNLHLYDEKGQAIGTAPKTDFDKDTPIVAIGAKGYLGVHRRGSPDNVYVYLRPIEVITADRPAGPCGGGDIALKANGAAVAGTPIMVSQGLGSGGSKCLPGGDK